MKQLLFISKWLMYPCLFLFIGQLTAAEKQQVTGLKSGQSTLIVYKEPNSRGDKDEIAVAEIPELQSGGHGLKVLEDANNGRFLNVEINGQPWWIKRKQVKTDLVYDVGKCEVSNKTTGIRGGINCTK